MCGPRHDMPRDGDTVETYKISINQHEAACCIAREPAVCTLVQMDSARGGLSQPKAEYGWTQVVLCDTNSEKGGRSLARALVRT